MLNDYLIDYLESLDPAFYGNITGMQRSALDEVEDALLTKGSDLKLRMSDLPDDPQLLARIAFWQLTMHPVETTALVTANLAHKIYLATAAKGLTQGFNVKKQQRFRIWMQAGGALSIYQPGESVMGYVFHTLIIAPPTPWSGLSDAQLQMREEWYRHLDCRLYMGGGKLTFID